MKKIVSTAKKYTYERMCSEIGLLQRYYPRDVAVSSIGSSVQRRDILCLKIGSGQANLLMVAAHHAREYITSVFAMATAERFLRKIAEKDESLIELLKDVSVYILPMLNPDGVEIAIKGKKVVTPAIANMKKIHMGYETWKANANGVDLNRHYPCLFEKKRSCVHEPASELFKGYAPATEPEVRALMRFTREIPFELAATFHSKGEEIYWADENTPNLIEKTRPIARIMGKETGYKLMPPSKDPANYAAGFENWFRHVYGKPCLLFELSPFMGGYFPHPMERFHELVWSKTKNLGRTLAGQTALISSLP